MHIKHLGWCSTVICILYGFVGVLVWCCCSRSAADIVLGASGCGKAALMMYIVL